MGVMSKMIKAQETEGGNSFTTSVHPLTSRAEARALEGAVCPVFGGTEGREGEGYGHVLSEEEEVGGVVRGCRVCFSFPFLYLPSPFMFSSFFGSFLLLFVLC